MTNRAPLAIGLALAGVLIGDALALGPARDDGGDVALRPAAAQEQVLERPVLSAEAPASAPAPAAPPTTAAPAVAPPTTQPPQPSQRDATTALATRNPFTGPYAPVAMPTCPTLPPGAGKPVTRRPAVPESAVPGPVNAPAPRADLAALRGRSVWITPFQTSSVDVAGLVARSKRAGLTAIWVRTGGSKQGYYGAPLLRRLVPAAHAAGIKVIAWDFPFLSDPAKDVARARQVLAFRVGGQGIDAFSPDIETTAEGTYPTPRRLAAYLSRVRVAAGDRAVVSTVPRPTDKNLRNYPYAAQVRWIDAFAPMIYWSCREPGALAQQSLQRLGGMRPVHVVGQGYDMGSEGGRRGLPTAKETYRFLDAGRRAGAIGGSLWTAERFGPAQWEPLTRYVWPR